MVCFTSRRTFGLRTTSRAVQSPVSVEVMNFLKSAVASIAQGPAFPYTFGDRVDIDQSIWTLQNGTKRVGAISDCYREMLATD